MTRMPREEEDPECTIAPTPSSYPTVVPVPTTPWHTMKRMPATPFPTEYNITRPPTPNAQSGGSNDTQRELSSFWPGYNPCIVPKPQIHSLLLVDDRLTTLVSEPQSDWACQEGGQTIINAENMVIRVYDATNIPTNGDPLTLKKSKQLDSWETRHMLLRFWIPARSLVFFSQLTTILSHSVISTSLDTGEQNWNVSLDEGLNIT